MFSWGLFQKWEDWVKVYEHIFLLFLYIARLMSRGDEYLLEVPNKTMGSGEMVAYWKEWAYMLHQIPFQSSTLRSSDLSVGEGC